MSAKIAELTVDQIPSCQLELSPVPETVPFVPMIIEKSCPHAILDAVTGVVFEVNVDVLGIPEATSWPEIFHPAPRTVPLPSMIIE